MNMNMNKSIHDSDHNFMATDVHTNHKNWNIPKVRSRPGRNADIHNRFLETNDVDCSQMITILIMRVLSCWLLTRSPFPFPSSRFSLLSSPLLSGSPPLLLSPLLSSCFFFSVQAAVILLDYSIAYIARTNWKQISSWSSNICQRAFQRGNEMRAFPPKSRP